MIEERVDDEKGDSNEGGIFDKVLGLKQLGEEIREKTQKMYEGFMVLEKVYGKVNKEVLWQILGI